MTDPHGKRDFQKWFCCCVYNHNLKSNPLRFLTHHLSFYQKLVLPDMYAYLPVLQLIRTIKSWFLVCLLLCQVSSVAQSCPLWTTWTAAHQVSVSITNSQNLLKLRSFRLVMPSNNLFLSLLLFSFSSSLHSFLASGSFQMSQFFTSDGQSTGVSASASVLIKNILQWFSFSVDWLDLLAVQGNLKSLLQHHNLKASILWHSAFYMVQLSTFVHDEWKKHSFGYADLCWQSDISTF